MANPLTQNGPITSSDADTLTDLARLIVEDISRKIDLKTQSTGNSKIVDDQLKKLVEKNRAVLDQQAKKIDQITQDIAKKFDPRTRAYFLLEENLKNQSDSLEHLGLMTKTVKAFEDKIQDALDQSKTNSTISNVSVQLKRLKEFQKEVDGFTSQSNQEEAKIINEMLSKAKSVVSRDLTKQRIYGNLIFDNLKKQFDFEGMFRSAFDDKIVGGFFNFGLDVIKDFRQKRKEMASKLVQDQLEQKKELEETYQKQVTSAKNVVDALDTKTQKTAKNTKSQTSPTNTQSPSQTVAPTLSGSKRQISPERLEQMRESGRRLAALRKEQLAEEKAKKQAGMTDNTQVVSALNKLVTLTQDNKSEIHSLVGIQKEILSDTKENKFEKAEITKEQMQSFGTTFISPAANNDRNQSFLKGLGGLAEKTDDGVGIGETIGGIAGGSYLLKRAGQIFGKYKKPLAGIGGVALKRGLPLLGLLDLFNSASDGKKVSEDLGVNKFTGAASDFIGGDGVFGGALKGGSLGAFGGPLGILIGGLLGATGGALGTQNVAKGITGIGDFFQGTMDRNANGSLLTATLPTMIGRLLESKKGKLQRDSVDTASELMKERDIYRRAEERDKKSPGSGFSQNWFKALFTDGVTASKEQQQKKIRDLEQKLLQDTLEIQREEKREKLSRDKLNGKNLLDELLTEPRIQPTYVEENQIRQKLLQEQLRKDQFELNTEKRSTMRGKRPGQIRKELQSINQRQKAISERGTITKAPAGLGSDLSKLTPEHHAWIAKYSQEYGVDPTWVYGMLKQESGGNINAQSDAGAFGLMQLMPGTAKDLGVDRTNPEENIKGGIKYIAQLKKQFGDSLPDVAGAYNYGPGNYSNYLKGRQGLASETEDYIAKVTRNQSVYERERSQLMMAQNKLGMTDPIADLRNSIEQKDQKQSVQVAPMQSGQNFTSIDTSTQNNVVISGDLSNPDRSYRAASSGNFHGIY